MTFSDGIFKSQIKSKSTSLLKASIQRSLSKTQIPIDKENFTGESKRRSIKVHLIQLDYHYDGV